MLELDDVELDVTVTFQKKGKAGIQIWVVNVGAGIESGQAHRIKVSFKPHGTHAFLSGDDQERIDVTYEE